MRIFRTRTSVLLAAVVSVASASAAFANSPTTTVVGTSESIQTNLVESILESNALVLDEAVFTNEPSNIGAGFVAQNDSEKNISAVDTSNVTVINSGLAAVDMTVNGEKHIIQAGSDAVVPSVGGSMSVNISQSQDGSVDSNDKQKTRIRIKESAESSTETTERSKTKIR